MPLTISCPNCATKLKVPDEAVGRKVKCPKCATLISVGVEEPPPPVAAAEASDVELFPVSGPTGRSAESNGGDQPGPRKKSKVGLIVGLVVGLVLLSGCCCGGIGIGVYVILLPETNAEVTETNAQKLKPDMTLAQVEAVLGKGTGKQASMTDVREAIYRDPRKSFNSLQASYTKSVANGHVYRWKNGKEASIIIVFTAPPESGGKAQYIYYTSKTDSATAQVEKGNPNF